LINYTEADYTNNHNDDHNDNHEHEHNHNNDISDIKGINLVFVVLLNFIIAISQIIGGIYSGSLSLISDALHNFSDGIAIAISYIAIKISNKGNDEKKTFGYNRSTILAALFNSLILIVISVFLLKETYFKFLNPQPIKGNIVIWVALVGLIANMIGVLLLQKGSKGDINIKSSYLHLLSDALFSLSIVIGGIIIYYLKIYWIDPLLTLIISLYILKESFEIIKKAINILMQGTPDNINLDEIVKDIEQIDNVVRVHHVHVWSLNENNINFEAHININNMMVSETKVILEEIRQQLLHLNINHVTIQFEYDCCNDVDIIKKKKC
jgi:cobalt-zinc-cadmium efflux system protein